MGALLLVGAAACGGRESGGTSASSVAGGSSSSSARELPACLGGPGLPPIDVYGVECYPGGPLSGACTEGTPTCSFCALPVLCTPTFGPRTSYACACVSGQWSCTATWRDSAQCAGDAGDAGESTGDAAGDDAADASGAVAVTSDGAVCAPGEIACGDPCGWSTGTWCQDAAMCPQPLPCPP
jgi:hypothetical protein